ncbi:helix-turn-helix transcriptional regulator [Metasolibacillus meyeri]|uniref:Helix-turn-helix transcriptional regulator n=1 Tax=Metasolibacillus meyeri TaxID=1071052 RepID=A0AAW9NSS3_9BACL|nr:helix-turn-helix transcriptional regulator [Metasolibacillus meyeri]MEC1180752.1 helix-turn-helix transcriptional regulator [Metasolibacillus meyeri]
MNYGETLKLIRKNKGYSQQDLAKNILSQSSFSKFEHNQSDINFVAFHQLLERLNMTYNEFSFIHEGFQKHPKSQLIQDFFSLPYNSKLELQKMQATIENYLQHEADLLLEDLRIVCIALLHLQDKQGMENARKLVAPIWERMSALHNWYVIDFLLLNTILYVFSTETAIEISKNMLQRLEKYKQFDEVRLLKASIQINISLLLIKNEQYNEALQVINQLLNERLKTLPYVLLAVCLSRKEVCSQKLNPSTETPYLSKALELVKIYEDDALLNTLTSEYEKYVN